MTTFREKAIEELARLEHEVAELRAYLELTGASLGTARVLDLPDPPAPPSSDPVRAHLEAQLAAHIAAQPAPRIAQPTVIPSEHVAQLARRSAVALSPDEEHAAAQERLDRMLKGVPVRATGALVSDPSTGSVIRTP